MAALKEFVVTFHVTAVDEEFVENWRKQALAILDDNQPKLVISASDEGAFCSGHVSQGKVKAASNPAPISCIQRCSCIQRWIQSLRLRGYL